MKRFNDGLLAVTFSDDVIQRLKERYSAVELTDMMAPVVKIRSNRLGYRISYQVDEAQAKLLLLASKIS